MEKIAVDIIDEKLRLTMELGASAVINARKEDPVKAVRKILKEGVDAALEAIGNPEVMRQAFGSVKEGGPVVIAGYADKDLYVSAARLMFEEIEVFWFSGVQSRRLSAASGFGS